jgi:hypothetical protein
MKALNASMKAGRALGVELIILLFCVGILQEVGKTKGPTFDSIGPDVIPQTLAILVILLLSVQIIFNVVELLSSGPEVKEAGLDKNKLKPFVFFIVVTGTFLLALRLWLAPLVILTPIFILVATLIFANNLKKKTIITGSAIGVAIGLVQYIIFTNFINVDLFVTF